jgi:hypothetical protein
VASAKEVNPENESFVFYISPRITLSAYHHHKAALFTNTTYVASKVWLSCIKYGMSSDTQVEKTAKSVKFVVAKEFFADIMFHMNTNCTVYFVLRADISLNTLLLRRQAH